jgi:sec-independent protein translocase protein TatA
VQDVPDLYAQSQAGHRAEWREEASIVLAEILGPDLLIVVGILVLLFGGSQIPKLARSLGQTSKEFRKGLAEGDEPDDKRA